MQQREQDVTNSCSVKSSIEFLEDATSMIVQRVY